MSGAPPAATMRPKAGVKRATGAVPGFAGEEMRLVAAWRARLAGSSRTGRDYMGVDAAKRGGDVGKGVPDSVWCFRCCGACV